MSRFHINHGPMEGGRLVRNALKRGFLPSIFLCSRSETSVSGPVGQDVAGGGQLATTWLEKSCVAAAGASVQMLTDSEWHSPVCAQALRLQKGCHMLHLKASLSERQSP